MSIVNLTYSVWRLFRVDSLRLSAPSVVRWCRQRRW